jgi:hypothetical protein
MISIETITYKLQKYYCHKVLMKLGQITKAKGGIEWC